jgi:hypothetical protein
MRNAPALMFGGRQGANGASVWTMSISANLLRRQRKHHSGESVMKYLGLAYYSPEKFAAMAPDAVDALVSQCPALDEKMRATGKVLVAASLGEPDKWKTLRPSAGKAEVSDGPYTESKELVGGLFVIEAESHDEAERLASMHPAATLGEDGGWAVQLIPIDFYLGG